MDHPHDHRLLILSDADGSVHNPIVEALAAGMSSEHYDVLTQWDICSRLAEADPVCLEPIAKIARDGNYSAILLIVHAETADDAGYVAEAAQVLSECLGQTDVRGMVLHGRSLATVSC